MLERKPLMQRGKSQRAAGGSHQAVRPVKSAGERGQRPLPRGLSMRHERVVAEHAGRTSFDD